MEIKNRLFPYPVLCKETDDYVGGLFNVKMTLAEKVNHFDFKFEFELDNDDLLNLIRQGKAQFVAHIECPLTSFRRVVKSNVVDINVSVPKSKVNREVSIVGMVVSTTKILSFSSETLNEDYLGERVNFDCASILAYDNLPKIVISKDYEQLSEDDNIFSVIRIEYPDPDNDHLVDVVLNEDRIKIKVDSRTYDAYFKYKQSKELSMSLLALPALMHMITSLREEGSVSPYESLRWFVVMKRYFKVHGKDFVDELLGDDCDTAFDLAQEMLKLPIGKAYNELMEMVE